MSGEIGLGEEELTTHIFLSLGDVLLQLFQLLLDVCHSHNRVSLDLIMGRETCKIPDNRLMLHSWLTINKYRHFAIYTP